MYHFYSSIVQEASQSILLGPPLLANHPIHFLNKCLRQALQSLSLSLLYFQMGFPLQLFYNRITDQNKTLRSEKG